MRAHGEPERVNTRPSRCLACGLPMDPAKARLLTERAEALERIRGAQTWTWCYLCGRETCKLLQRLCAEEAEKEAERGG